MAASTKLRVGHLAAVSGGNIARRPAHAAAEVDNPVQGFEIGQPDHFCGRLAAAGMHLVDHLEVVYRERGEVLAVRLEGGQDRLDQIFLRVMRRDCFGMPLHGLDLSSPFRSSKAPAALA